MLDTLDTGREAIKRHDWDAACRALTEADQDDGLSPDDLMLLGDAYWWTAQPDEAVETFERAYAGYVKQGRPSEAATVGGLLAYFAMRRMSMSVASGWVSRVESLLADEPEGAGHAWLELLHVAEALFGRHDLEAVIATADETIEIARRQGAPGIQSLAMSFKGIALVFKGEWRKGVAVIDEATVVAMSPEGDLRASSDVYCNTIAACSSLADYGRAGEWTEQAERWMKANSVGGFTGVCAVHRAELKRLKGSWTEAEQAARSACVELKRFHLMDGLGYANYEIGEVRRRMGDLEAAEEAFSIAYEYGHPAQPGLALLMMDRGETDDALKSITGALAESGRLGQGSADLLGRGHLLPAQVEIAIAAGDMETAGASIAELEEIAEVYDAPTWEAMALSCRGALALSEGNPERALEVLNRAWRIWQQVELPYEAARSREMLGRARLALGDERGAGLEFRAARSVFSQLGASIDLKRLDQTSGSGAKRSDESGDRITKVFMFSDIVTSTDLVDIIGDGAWERLLQWHDRELREIITHHGGEEVRHTGDGFFVAFDDPRSAVDCAVSIQRRLSKHRLEHGFSPTVRIGLHLAEATRQRGDYSGKGVHAAARIGDLGEGEEIVVSGALFEAAGNIPYPASDPRTVTLKGISEPMEVRTVAWRS